MPPVPTVLTEFVTLSRGLTAKLALTPMPQPGEDGRYPIRVDVDIEVHVHRGPALIDTQPWNALICAERTIALADGTVLSNEDLYTLDTDGWAILLRYGLVPTAWAGD